MALQFTFIVLMTIKKNERRKKYFWWRPKFPFYSTFSFLFLSFSVRQKWTNKKTRQKNEQLNFMVWKRKEKIEIVSKTMWKSNKFGLHVLKIGCASIIRFPFLFFAHWEVNSNWQTQQNQPQKYLQFFQRWISLECLARHTRNIVVAEIAVHRKQNKTENKRK